MAFGWWAFSVASDGLEAELGRTLSGIAESIAADYSAGGTAGRLARLTDDSHTVRGGLRDRLTAIRDRTGVERIRVLDPDLRSLVDTEETEPFVRYFDLERDLFEIEQVLETGEGTSSVLFYGVAGTAYKVGYGLVSGADGPIALIAVEGSASYFTLLQGFRAQVAAFGLVVLLLVVIVTILVSRRITAPLSALSDAAQRIGGGDMETPVQLGGVDEIGELARALAQMQSDIAGRDEERQMMLAGIAHEIRNPLGGMELFVGLLEDSLPAESDDAAHAAKVRRELNYLTRVVDEFLRFARDRRLESTRRRVDGLLDEVAGSVSIAADKGVEIVTDVPDGLEVSADLAALRGVLINLAQNAVQASEPGATVKISAFAEGDGRRIRVEDDGAGMTEEVLGNVMRPFYTTREKGTGLGLPLARKVIERHGGKLTIDSQPGEGTRVDITLPFDESASVAASESTMIPLDDTDWNGEMIG